MDAHTSSGRLAAAAIAGLTSGLAACGGGADVKKEGPAPSGTTPGAAATPAMTAAGADAKKADCCAGKNECKGKGGCKTDKNDCKFKNECKGQGGCPMRGCE